MNRGRENARSGCWSLSYSCVESMDMEVDARGELRGEESAACET